MDVKVGRGKYVHADIIRGKETSNVIYNDMGFHYFQFYFFNDGS